MTFRLYWYKQRNETLTMQMLCFGDSNTYGYDPRGYLGGQYPAEGRWVDILAEKTGWDIRNEGKCGREIPWQHYQRNRTEQLFEQSTPDVFTVMLGTNDLLQGASVQEVCSRMEAFLQHLQPKCAAILLIAPPPMKPGAWVTEERLILDSLQLSEEYRTLSEKMGISFADAGKWNVPLAFDGVHFTEGGHRAFAEGLYGWLMKNV